ncbi:hypothetical protein ACOI1H_08120 [Loktanella sp. DJP18]|uniref:hypothetical protein n=1 Tax=Loktanella sp. DJP18 TaxID=3409788 RepID=UPI003BB49D0C
MSFQDKMLRGERIISSLASVTGIITFFVAAVTAGYAFIYPGEAAKKVASFQDLIEDARVDITRIADAAEETVVNTAQTSDNTAKMVDAIPYWMNFIVPPELVRSTDYDYENRPGAKAYYSHLYLRNPSPYSIDFSISVKLGGEDVFNKNAILPPSETVDYFIDSDDIGNGDIVFCISGTSKGFEGNTFYERKLYNGSQVVEFEQSFSQVDGC